MSESTSYRPSARAWISLGFRVVEDIVYVGLGLLLAWSAMMLLGNAAIYMARSVSGGSLPGHAIELLDRILLVLLVVELLYTVQVSFREHALIPEPFLLIALIAAIRRVLVMTAQYGEIHEKSALAVKFFVAELGILTVLVMAMVASLILLRKAGTAVRAERH